MLTEVPSTPYILPNRMPRNGERNHPTSLRRIQQRWKTGTGIEWHCQSPGVRKKRIFRKKIAAGYPVLLRGNGGEVLKTCRWKPSRACGTGKGSVGELRNQWEGKHQESAWVLSSGRIGNKLHLDYEGRCSCYLLHLHSKIYQTLLWSMAVVLPVWSPDLHR